MNERFEQARGQVVFAMKEYAGFGTYGEKSIHAVLKRYIEPDTDFHEVGVMGSIADICRDDRIFEIQTHSLYRLKAKLEKFLPYYKVCVVFPVVAQKTVYTLHPESLEVSGKRKSPKKGSVYDFLPEVYGLRQFLGNENLSFRIMVINASEYRLPSPKGYRRRGEKFDTVPDELVCEITLAHTKNFIKLIPLDLPEKFGSLEYAKCAHITRSDAAVSLNILAKCGIIEKIDKKGNAFVYRIIE